MTPVHNQGCLEDLEVADIMTSPAISVRPTDSVYSAMDLMVEKNISGIPVVGAPAIEGTPKTYTITSCEPT